MILYISTSVPAPTQSTWAVQRGVGTANSTLKGADRDMVKLSDHNTTPYSCRQALLSLYPHSIQTVFIFVNSLMPTAPSSRPCPDHFTPPNGIRGSEATMRLINTIPASSSLINLCCSAGSLVQALAPSPNRLSFAIRMASVMSLARNTLATGPNISSLY